MGPQRPALGLRPSHLSTRCRLTARAIVRPVERRKILAAGVFLWSLLTAVSGMARNFSQLIVARLGVGIGEATCSPASTSLIGDLVRPTMRARAVAIWMLGLPLGLGLANGAGGWILQNWGWRNAFYIAAGEGAVADRGADDARAAAGTREQPRSVPAAARGILPASAVHSDHTGIIVPSVQNFNITARWLSRRTNPFHA